MTESATAPARRARTTARRRVLLRPRIAIPLGVLLACGIATAIVLAGHDADAPASLTPSASATPDATPSASPSPVVSVDANGHTLPGFVTHDASLPYALPLPPGIWDKTGPGWVLASYLPSILSGGQVFHPEVAGATTHVVYLSSPDGTLYQVAEMDPNQPFRIESWSAGDTTAYIRTCPEPGGCTYNGTSGQVLDLTTGAISSVVLPFDPETFYISQTTPSGIRVWDSNENGGSYLDKDGTFTFLGEQWSAADQPVSPDGAWLALSIEGTYFPTEGTAYSPIAVASLATGKIVVAPSVVNSRWTYFCNSDGWIDGTHFSYTCFDEDLGTTSGFVLDVASGASDLVSTGEYSNSDSPERGRVDPSVSNSVLVSPGVWVGYYDDGSPYTEGDSFPPLPLAIDDHGSISMVPLADAAGHLAVRSRIVTSLGAVVYLDASLEDYGVPGFEFIVAFNAATGRQVVLLPSPPTRPVADAVTDPNARLVGIESWVVAQ